MRVRWSSLPISSGINVLTFRLPSSWSLNYTCFVSLYFTLDWPSFCLWSTRCNWWRGYRPQACPSVRTHRPSWSRPSESSCHYFDRQEDPQNLPVVKVQDRKQRKWENKIRYAKFSQNNRNIINIWFPGFSTLCNIMVPLNCDILTLHASSRPRVSPAHSMLEVTVRPDSTSDTQRSLGHRRTWPLFTRSEYSAETGESIYIMQVYVSFCCCPLLDIPGSALKRHDWLRAAYILFLFHSLRFHTRSSRATPAPVRAGTQGKPLESLQHRFRYLSSALRELQLE